MMTRVVWGEEDGFYDDVLRLPDGRATRLKGRSIVGLLPLCATPGVEPWLRERIPRPNALLRERIHQMPELLRVIHRPGPGHFGVAERGIIALFTPARLRRVLAKMLDEEEVLSPYGIRSRSKFPERNPYVVYVNGQASRVDYLPAASNTGLFGGNANWQGRLWFPVHALVMRARRQCSLDYGDDIHVACPTGSGKRLNLFEVAREVADRLTRIFLREERGRRPIDGGTTKFPNDPHWRDYLLFYEYLHGDNGAGLGARHQTGWTGVVGGLIHLFGVLAPRRVLEVGQLAAFASK